MTYNDFLKEKANFWRAVNNLKSLYNGEMAAADFRYYTAQNDADRAKYKAAIDELKAAFQRDLKPHQDALNQAALIIGLPAI